VSLGFFFAPGFAVPYVVFFSVGHKKNVLGIVIDKLYRVAEVGEIVLVFSVRAAGEVFVGREGNIVSAFCGDPKKVFERLPVATVTM
jgi:hypothetical protein